MRVERGAERPAFRSPSWRAFFTCSDPVISHCLFFLVVDQLGLGATDDASHRWRESGTDEGARKITIPSPTIASASGTSMAVLGGRTFWARTRTAITDIQVTLMKPSATSITISPMLEPTQQNPNWSPERTLSRQSRRKCPLSGVNS